MNRTWLEMKKYKHCYLWIMPFFIIFLVFYLYPAVSGFFISLTDYDGLGAVAGAAKVGFKNYRKLFGDDKFWLALKNTFVVWLYIVPGRTFLALIMATLLNSSKLLGKKVYSVVVLILGQRIGWLDTTALSKVSVAIMNIWRMVGYFSLVLLAGMQKIPGSVHEAAAIDGAGKLTVFFKIVIPLMIFQNVGDVMVLTQGGPLNSSTTLVYYMYQNAYEYSKMGYAAAITYVLFLLLAVLSVFMVKSYYSKMED